MGARYTVVSICSWLWSPRRGDTVLHLPRRLPSPISDLDIPFLSYLYSPPTRPLEYKDAQGKKTRGIIAAGAHTRSRCVEVPRCVLASQPPIFLRLCLCPHRRCPHSVYLSHPTYTRTPLAHRSRMPEARLRAALSQQVLAHAPAAFTGPNVSLPPATDTFSPLPLAPLPKADLDIPFCTPYTFFSLILWSTRWPEERWR